MERSGDHEVAGSTIKVELNGAVILETDLAPIRAFEHRGKDRTSGYLGCRAASWRNRGNVDYRKIEIRDLPDADRPTRARRGP